MGLESGAVIKKLNKPCLNALQSAAGLCLSRSNYSVEVEHWLLRLADTTDGDLDRIFRRFEVEPSTVQRELTRAIDAFKTGNSRTPTLAPSIDELIRLSWVLASIQYQATAIRSGHLLLAVLQDEKMARMAKESSKELAKVHAEALFVEFAEIVEGSSESEGASKPTTSTAGDPLKTAGGPTPSLDQYTVNLTERARAGKIDRVVGRESEIRQMVDILIRRRQNNPILTGEAGVGKTAVVEGFACRIAEGDVPEVLKNVVLRTLDLGLLQAGAGVKGEFENRIKSVIEEVKASPVPVVLFIDEAHTMIGAGGQAGQGDAANLLKPALARGELRTIAATTWAEYKKYFEKDAALARRFQVVKVEEPSEERAILMMRGITGMLEQHHGVRILDEAVEASVQLSSRYIPGRQLPDKSVSLLDTACARVSIGQNVTPAVVEDCSRTIDHLKVELGILDRESATASHHAERIEETKAKLAEAEARLAKLDERWKKEKTLVAEVRERSVEIEGLHSKRSLVEGSPPPPEMAALREKLDAKVAELRGIQGDDPLMQVSVDSQTIAEVISGWTGIPVGKMLADEIRTVLSLQGKLAERVIGQSHALDAISQRIRTARANLTDPRKPIGVFLLVGPSGVGKTETALALADTLYGGERNLVTINMSEFQEPHTVASLKGSPPGYVGYGEGGVLTEAIRRKPYSVVLLDEVEKAHPDVMELFFQVFDKGTLDDGEGREIDFKNTIILLTSNVGTDTVMSLCADTSAIPPLGEIAEALRPDLLRVFPPALLGRMILVPYLPIGDEIMRQIIVLQLGRIAKRMKQNHKAAFTFSDELVGSIAERCREVESGARNVDHILTRSLLPEMSQEFLTRMADGRSISSVHVSVDPEGNFLYDIA